VGQVLNLNKTILQKGKKRGVCASTPLSRTASLRQAQAKPSPLSRTAIYAVLSNSLLIRVEL